MFIHLFQSLKAIGNGRLLVRLRKLVPVYINAKRNGAAQASLRICVAYDSNYISQF